MAGVGYLALGLAAKTAGPALLVSGACVLAAPVALGTIGFSSGGVVAGSIAAAVQPIYGGFVPAGSVFATLQSAGAVGAVALGTKTAATAAGSFAIGGLLTYCGLRG